MDSNAIFLIKELIGLRCRIPVNIDDEERFASSFTDKSPVYVIACPFALVHYEDEFFGSDTSSGVIVCSPKEYERIKDFDKIGLYDAYQSSPLGDDSYKMVEFEEVKILTEDVEQKLNIIPYK